MRAAELLSGRQRQALTLYFQVDGGDGETQYVGNFKLSRISSPDLIQNHQRVLQRETALKPLLILGLKSKNVRLFYFF